jgi:cytochrome c oxidase assembly protein subunit 11
MNREQQNRKLSTRLAIVALGMFGFGFALVPFYNQICAALGVNSLVERSELPKNTQVDASRTVTIELDANTRDLPWRFQPIVRHITVHPGEVATVEYEVINVRGSAVTGQAVPSYGPAFAGEYFHKM